MNSIVNFLGEEFTFSDDIKEYIAVSNIADQVHHSLMNSFIDKIKRDESSFTNTQAMNEDIKKQAERFIERLCNNGIYSATINEYVDGNVGYEAIDAVNQAAVKAFASYLIDEIKSFKQGMQEAESDALSQVTGSGVSVYTSSMLTLAVTSAMESAIL